MFKILYMKTLTKINIEELKNEMPVLSDLENLIMK